MTQRWKLGFQFHLSTAIVMMCLANALIYLNITPLSYDMDLDKPLPVSWGWPWMARALTYSNSVEFRETRLEDYIADHWVTVHWDWKFGVPADIAVAVSILASGYFVTEYFCKARPKVSKHRGAQL